MASDSAWSIPFDEALEAEFLELLRSPAPPGGSKEFLVQEYLEDHPELIPTPNLLNHHLHFGLILSQFPLDTSLVTDYAYLTKSSDSWRVTFVELESPDKHLFRESRRQVGFSAELNDAIAQVRSWKIFVEDNPTEIKRRLKPILMPLGMQRNPVEFQYQLIIGRSNEKNESEPRKKSLAAL